MQSLYSTLFSITVPKLHNCNQSLLHCAYNLHCKLSSVSVGHTLILIVLVKNANKTDCLVFQTYMQVCCVKINYIFHFQRIQDQKVRRFALAEFKRWISG